MMLWPPQWFRVKQAPPEVPAEPEDHYFALEDKTLNLLAELHKAVTIEETNSHLIAARNHVSEAYRHLRHAERQWVRRHQEVG